MKSVTPLFFAITTFFILIVGQIVYQKTVILNQSNTNPEKTILLENAYRSVESKIFEAVALKKQAPIILLYFWAPWCSVCLNELPSLVEFQKHFKKDQVQIYSFASDQSKDAIMVKKIKDQYQINFPIFIDRTDEYFHLFQIYSIPTTIVYIKGRLIEKQNKPLDYMSAERIDFFYRLLNQAKTL